MEMLINVIHSSLHRIALIFCVLLWASGTALAHDPGLSAAEIRIGEAEVLVQLSIACSDIRSVIALDAECGNLRGGSLTAASPRLEEFGRHAIELWFADQRVEPAAIEVNVDQTGAIDFLIRFTRGPGSQIKIRSAAIGSLSRGHRQYLSALDEHGNKLADMILDSSSDKLDVDAPSGARTGSLLQFLGLGVEHILTGYDHLVFLLGLLLVGAGFRDVARIITSFTAAHSITLALSTLDVVRIPPAIVEPMIAISIVYVGVENIFRRDLRWRWLLTFCFGVMHGFGFASALRDLGIGAGGGVALPLVSFNVGVELGQLGVAVVVFPLIWRYRKRPVFATRFAPACSILTSIAGVFWLIERIVE